ncbi:MAG: hypothetical protein H0U95_04410 [Bacteroidetes bacterium]|nr:hypothetical protein [Bacteroidota bacterium]
MEENENKTKSEDNTQKTNKNKSSNPLEGLNLDGLNIPDWLKHLLTGAGSLGANYFLFIKPMQDKMEEMQKEIGGQKDRIKDLENEQDRLILQLNNEANQKRKQGDDDLFTTKRAYENAGKSAHYKRSVHL